MRTFSLIAGLLALAASAGAQNPPAPPPATTPKAPPAPPAAKPAPAPPRSFDFSREWLDDVQRTAMERAREQMERSRDLQERAMERAREEMERTRDLQHDAMERAREQMEREMERTHDRQWDLEHRFAFVRPELEARLQDLQFQLPAMPPLPPLPPMSFEFDWHGGGELRAEAGGTLHLIRPAQGSPEDSLYRRALEALNRGEWARAAGLFQSLEQKYPKSRVAPAALYYQAFALYRSGTTDQLHGAVEALRAQQQRYPEAAADPDAGALRTRLYAALAARGDAQAAAALRAAISTGSGCDKEDIEVRAEALNALTQLDPEGASAALKKVLARRDECSVTLRRRAVYLLARNGSEAATNDLLEVARTDPDPSVKSDAISLLGRSSFASVTTRSLEQLFNDNPDGRTRQAVLSALRNRGDADSRRALRTIIERTDVPERTRAQAISQLAGSSFTWVEVSPRGRAEAVAVAVEAARRPVAGGGGTEPSPACRRKTPPSSAVSTARPTRGRSRARFSRRWGRMAARRMSNGSWASSGIPQKRARFAARPCPVSRAVPFPWKTSVSCSMRSRSGSSAWPW